MVEMDPRNILAIVNLTGDCNMDCRYCYNKTRDTPGRMSIETAEEMMHQVVDYNNGTSHFIWHGGEPLLMELDFFEEIVGIQKGLSKKIRNSIQINATLLNEDFVEFFKRNNFHVGISLDGPRDIHDMNRIFMNGSGSFDKVMESITLMRGKRLMNFGCLAILTKHNISRIDDIYRFFKSEGFNFLINPVFPEKQYNGMVLTPEEFGNSLIRLFDLWYSDFDEGNKITVKPLNFFIMSMISKRSTACINEGNCSRGYITINKEGHVFPCQRFIGLKGFDFGTIFDRTITEILESEEYSKLERYIENIKECRECKWLKICNGGCMYYAYAGNGSIYARDYYCKSRKMLFEHINKKLRIGF